MCRMMPLLPCCACTGWSGIGKLEFIGQWEVQPNKRCHSELVRTLAWESPSFKGEPAEKVTPYLWGLPHHSAEWFAMTLSLGIGICPINGNLNIE